MTPDQLAELPIERRKRGLQLSRRQRAELLRIEARMGPVDVRQLVKGGEIRVRLLGQAIRRKATAEETQPRTAAPTLTIDPAGRVTANEIEEV